LSLWKVIAKNEIRLKTSWVKRKRKLFFIIILGILLFWAFYLGPILLDSIIPEIFKNYTSNFEFLIKTIIESTLASFFLIYVLYPLLILFRKESTDKKEIMLGTPVKGTDIFLGEFFGQFPFNILFILGISSIITPIKSPLF